MVDCKSGKSNSDKEDGICYLGLRVLSSGFIHSERTVVACIAPSPERIRAHIRFRD